MGVEPVVFTLPYSQEEILALSVDDCNFGVVYSPHRMGSPTPWSSACKHCIQGQQVGLSITSKRLIKVLCSREVSHDKEDYTVPTNNAPCYLRCRRKDGVLSVLVVLSDDQRIEVTYTKDRPPFLNQHKILNRTLMMLDTIRSPTRREISACLKPLADEQRRSGIATNRRHLCLKIDWASVMSQK